MTTTLLASIIESQKGRCTCGSPLDIVNDGHVGVAVASTNELRDAPVRYEMRRMPFVACTGCDFCEEVYRG